MLSTANQDGRGKTHGQTAMPQPAAQQGSAPCLRCTLHAAPLAAACPCACTCLQLRFVWPLPRPRRDAGCRVPTETGAGMRRAEVRRGLSHDASVPLAVAHGAGPCHLALACDSRRYAARPPCAHRTSKEAVRRSLARSLVWNRICYSSRNSAHRHRSTLDGKGLVCVSLASLAAHLPFCTP
jgi:hypothetical protein